MSPVSKRNRDELMRFITNYYLWQETWDAPLTSVDPRLLALGNRMDVGRALHVLAGLGLLRYKVDADSGVLTIALTPDGKCYFEKRADARREFWMKSVLIPILLAAVTTIITVYLLPRLGEGAAQFLSTLRGETPAPVSTALPAPTPE